MLSESTIDPQTIRAYLETEYHVREDAGFILRVGLISSCLLASHQRRRVECSAFLTACNPFSKAFEPDANNARQQALAKELELRSLAYVKGVGLHPSNNWPGEESFLIFGLTLEAAKTLANSLEQNGFIWSDADAIPQLILLK